MSSYKETLDWLFNQLPMYQQKGVSAYKADLSNITLLCNHLGNPHHNTNFIHVAGTNGKGSVSHMLSSVLQEAGYSVGLYTSPHLIDFRERIKINKEEIPEQYIVDFVRKHRSFFQKNHLSFFEMTVGLAFQYFQEKQVDIAIIEVGLGGRLDATNILTPELSIITTIGIDHTNFLGDTFALIASEKAGIIKKNIPVVIGEYNTETKPVFEVKASKEYAPIYWASDAVDNVLESDLKGGYQQSNIKTVIQSIALLSQNEQFVISDEALVMGLQHVTNNTGILGRWQQIQEDPLVICDTGHNEQGLIQVTQQIIAQKYDKLYIVLGVVDDKDLDTILPLFPKEAYYIFTKPEIARGLNEKFLMQKADKFNLFGETQPTVIEAYNKAIDLSGGDDFIFVGGSTFVVGDFLLKKTWR